MSAEGGEAKWPAGHLGDLCEIRIGRTPARNRSDYWGPGSPWLSIADMNQGRDLNVTAETITDVAVRECNCRLVPARTVLLSFKLSVGKVGITRRPLFTNEAIAALPIKDTSKLLPEFLYWSLRSIDLTLGLDRAAKGLTLNSDKLHRIRIPVPPLSEQRRIAEILEAADSLRARRSAALAELSALTDSIFLGMFADTETPNRTIGQLLDSGALLLHKDGNHGSLYPRADDFGDSGIPFLSAKAVSDDGAIDCGLVEHLREEKANRLKIGWILKGDVLLAHNASVGKVAFYDGRFGRALIGTSLTAFRPNPQALDSIYLAAALRALPFQRQLTKNMGQTTRNQVPITAQRDLMVGLPSIELQREFAQKTAAVETLRVSYRASLKEMDALFASVQQRAVNGDLSP